MAKVDQKTEKRKALMLEALERNLGVVTISAKSVGIERQTHYLWMKKDPKYREAVEELENVALDFVESKLHTNIQKGKEVSILFYLKTKGKKRGYIEKVEIDQRTEHTIDWEKIPITERKRILGILDRVNG